LKESTNKELTMI